RPTRFWPDLEALAAASARLLNAVLDTSTATTREIHCSLRPICMFLDSMKLTYSLLIVAAMCFVGLASLSATETSSQTPKKPVTDEYQGVKVQDDYQWLEKDDDPEVSAWSNAQNQRTRAYLDKLPDRAAIEKQLT